MITFNYDTLLERACDQIGKPYRMAPSRYKSVHAGSGIVDPTPEREIVILKVHGSIDWFDRKRFLRCIEAGRSQGFPDYMPDDPIFNCEPPFEVSPLVSGPRMEDDPLKETYRVHDIDRLYARPPLFIATPTLITPSTAKVVYANHLADYWSGMGRQGGWNARLVIIGYSLPPHDEYARQVIYRLVRNYQRNTERVKSP